MNHIKNHILPYTLIPLLILSISVSYFRFMVLHDNIVAYEGYCDETSESCFVGCEEEVDSLNECPADSIYYFTEVERYADDLVRLCSNSIIDCEEADYCTESETSCSIYYCDPELDIDEYTRESLCSSKNLLSPPSV